MLNEITDEQLEEYRMSCLDDKVDPERSYLVSYKDGIFTILFGSPPENFYLPFEEYKEKMTRKYGAPEYEIMVPIEE